MNMKKLFLLIPFFLISCSPKDELQFPSSSFGQAMQCVNTNYYAFFEKMTGDSSSDLQERVYEYCFNAISESIDRSLYSGSANLVKNETDNLVLSPTINAKDESKTLNHLLYKMRFMVSLQSEKLEDGECVPNVTFLYGTAVSDDVDDVDFSSKVVLRDQFNQPFYKLLEGDSCLQDWSDSIDYGYDGRLNSSEDWSWSIMSASGLHFDK